MINETYTPTPQSVLDVLSNQSLVALSNGLSIKAKQLNLKYRDIENEISLLDNQRNTPATAKYVDTPIALERGTLELALSAGLTKKDIFGDSTPVSDIDLEGIKLALESTKVTSKIDYRLPVDAEFQGLQYDRSSIKALIMLIGADIQKIGSTLDDRINGKKSEPQINYNLIDSLLDHNALSDLEKTTLQEHKELVLSKVVRPLQENKIALKAYKAQQKKNIPTPATSSQFDLIYGPPVSTKGQFVLTEDGLYYDSRNGGLPEIAVKKLVSKDWDLEFDPNKGGKGIKYDELDLNKFSNTIFSYEYTVTNTTVDKLYAIDTVLANIEATKSKIVNDVSIQIDDLTASGYDTSSALVQNYYRSLAAQATAFNEQIRRRKKQLQIAGLFGGFIITDRSFALGPNVIMKQLVGEEARRVIKLYGSNSEWTFSTDLKHATITRNSKPHAFRIYSVIPINDFSYLKGSGLNPTIDTQNKTLLQAADIDGIILPIEPKFLKSIRSNSVYLSDFSISKQGIGSLPYFSGTTHVEGSGPLIKSLTDDITTDGLIVLYNFVKGNVLSPFDSEYQLKNEAHIGSPLNGKLVGNTSSIFVSGFGIAKLGGTLYDPELSESPEPWYSHIEKGGYVILPNNCLDGKLYKGSNVLDDLTYGNNGFTIDAWLHLPEFTQLFSDSHRYRLLLGCENTGPGKGKNSNKPIMASRLVDEGVGNKQVDYEKVHGLIVGYAIDPNITTSFGEEDIVFGIWPTVSQNNPDGLWGPSVAIAEKVIGKNPLTATRTKLGMVVPLATLTNNGLNIGSVSSTFSHFNISFDYSKDQIRICLDSEVLATSSISQCFNINPGEPLNIPSPAYATTNLDDSTLWSWGVNLGRQDINTLTKEKYYESIHKGTPKAPSFPLFTPWVVGGGFTDSIPRSPNLERNISRQTTPLGFLGSNTNHSYFTGGVDSNGGVTGQHRPSMGGSRYSGLNRSIPRSALDGFVGSFKLYNKALSLKEVEKNYDSQQGFFKNIRVVEDPDVFIDVTYDISFSNTLPSTRRANFLSMHGLPGAITEQVSSLNRYYRGMSAIGDNLNVSSAFAHTKVFKTILSDFSTGYNFTPQMFFYVHRAKQLGYKVKLSLASFNSGSSIGIEAFYLSSINEYSRVMAQAISSLTVAQTIVDPDITFAYPGYNIDEVALENEPDLGWAGGILQGSESGFAYFIVSALRNVKSRLQGSGIAVPKMGPGGWSNNRKTVWWDNFFAQCSAQSYTPSSFAWHSYHRNGTKMSQFGVKELILGMATAHNVVSSYINLSMDEYHIDFFPVNNDNPNSVTPECDDHRGAAAIASYEIEAMKNNFHTMFFYIHDKTFSNPNVQYTDEWAGKSVGLWLVSGAPKPVWWAKQLLSKSTSGTTILNPTRNAQTLNRSWFTNCIGSLNSDDELTLLVVNAPLADSDYRLSEASGYYEKEFIDHMTFSNWNSSSYMNNFASAVGQGVDVAITGSALFANQSEHRNWGYRAMYNYVLELPCGSNPFNTTSSYNNKILTDFDVSSFVSGQHSYFTTGYGSALGYPSFSAGNPTWLDSLISVKEPTKALVSATSQTTQIQINFDANYIPTRVKKQFLIDRTNNVPSALPEFDLSDPNSAYCRLRADYPIAQSFSQQTVRFDAIDYGIDPPGKTYNFGTAGQVQELQGDSVSDLDVLNNRLVVTLEPNSVLMVVLERT